MPSNCSAALIGAILQDDVCPGCSVQCGNQAGVRVLPCLGKLLEELVLIKSTGITQSITCYLIDNRVSGRAIPWACV